MQAEILEEYSKLINYFDPSIKFQLFLFNRQVSEQALIEQFDFLCREMILTISVMNTRRC